MSLSVKNITWVRAPKMAHAFLGLIEGQRGNQRRIVMLVDERINPRRPVGGKVPDKFITLEVYLPLPAGQDRVLKFKSEDAAKAEAGKLLAKFVADVAEVL